MLVSSKVAAAHAFPGHRGRVCIGLFAAGGDPQPLGMGDDCTMGKY